MKTTKDNFWKKKIRIIGSHLLDRHRGRIPHKLRPGLTLARIHHRLHFVKGIWQSGGQLGVATKLLDELEAVCPSLPQFVDVGDATEQRTEDDLGVVLEEIDLKKKTRNKFVPYGKNLYGKWKVTSEPGEVLTVVWQMARYSQKKLLQYF